MSVPGRPRSQMQKPDAVDSISILGKRLREWRTGVGWPLKRVSSDLGISISILSEWERGRRFPSGKNLDVLSRYTGIPVSCFFCNREDGCPFLSSRLRERFPQVFH